MRSHLHLLGILQIVWGAIGLLLGVVLLLLAIGAIAIGISAPNERMAAGITAAGFVIFAVGLLTGGGANAWAGRALRRRQPAGRTATLWLAVLNLFVLPFGTALGIYAFWVLLHHENRAVFVAPDDRRWSPMPAGAASAGRPGATRTSGERDGRVTD